MSESQTLKHLEGQQNIGIYPLFKYNTSWFIAADDGDRIESAMNFMDDRLLVIIILLNILEWMIFENKLVIFHDTI